MPGVRVWLSAPRARAAVGAGGRSVRRRERSGEAVEGLCGETSDCFSLGGERCESRAASRRLWSGAVLCCEHRDSVPSVFPINCVRKDGAGRLRDGTQVAVRL